MVLSTKVYKLFKLTLALVFFFAKPFWLNNFKVFTTPNYGYYLCDDLEGTTRNG